jgi:hypothetical protein
MSKKYVVTNEVARFTVPGAAKGPSELGNRELKVYKPGDIVELPDNYPGIKTYSFLKPVQAPKAAPRTRPTPAQEVLPAVAKQKKVKLKH